MEHAGLALHPSTSLRMSHPATRAPKAKHMSTSTASSSSFQNTEGAQPGWVPGRCAPGMTGAAMLAAQWMLLAKLLIVAARRFSRLKTSGARGVDTRAEAFELQLRCLLIVLARQIDQCPDEEPEARQTLCVVYSALIALAMVTAKIRAELHMQSASSGAWNDLSTIIQTALRSANPGDNCLTPCVQIGARGYLDSS